MRFLILALSLLLFTAGCNGNGNAIMELPDSGMDGMVIDMDGSMNDGMVVGTDANMEDAGVDSSVADAGMDASVIDAGSDSGAIDAGMDSSTPMDAGMDSGPTQVCGNLIREGTEECDNGPTPTASSNCRSDCTFRTWYALPTYALSQPAPSCPTGTQVYDGISPTLTYIEANNSCAQSGTYTPVLTYVGNGLFECPGSVVSQKFKGCTAVGYKPAGSLGWVEYF